MKERWIATGLAGILVLSGAGMGYQAYAEQATDVQEIQTEETGGLEKTGQEPMLEPDPAAPQYNVDPASIPAEKKGLPKVLIEPDGTPTKPANVAIKDYGYGIVQSATYFANDGKQYYIVQSEVEPGEGISFIQNAESTYKEPVRHIEIGGYAAVAIDGEYRRVVHVLIDDQLLCVACWGLSAQELIAIAEQVVTRS
ncbi:hypothetical protein [Saccharibacillus endophyticus]|uniref:DUF4367 domain-containing protein n=1 Tax=Saccharibacillus endophyticus TaxID=2060666 RepID=A0ABQ1ZY09_9BACL|nr:hypothetical protein [Saccharibacillus endophyticus]GGH80376.1 hypothetical protein GCM10007362_28590 [Saccharibacillus endophyticus]